MRFKMKGLLLGMLLPLLFPLALSAQQAYVANARSNNVSVIDTSTNTVVATVTLFEPVAVAITPDGTRAWSPNSLSHCNAIQIP